MGPSPPYRTIVARVQRLMVACALQDGAPGDSDRLRAVGIRVGTARRSQRALGRSDRISAAAWRAGSRRDPAARARTGANASRSLSKDIHSSTSSILFHWFALILDAQ